MFISIPKDFFVPVVFSDEFRYNSDKDAMEYDTEYKTFENKNNRQKLQDLDYRGEDTGFTAEYLENLINIDDKEIEEQILNYSKSFLKFLEELRKANCLDSNKSDTVKLVNYYAKSLRDLYNNYKNLIVNVSMPISSADENQIIDKFIGELEDIYNKNLADLNCKNLNYDTLEATLDQLFDDARDILREEIRNINCELVNVRSTCKNSDEVKNKATEVERIYQKLDNEFLMEMKKS